MIGFGLGIGFGTLPFSVIVVVCIRQYRVRYVVVRAARGTPFVVVCGLSFPVIHTVLSAP